MLEFAQGVVVECGSGLTTAFGLDKTSVKSWIALENDNTWSKNLPILESKLVPYGSYVWYDEGAIKHIASECERLESKVCLVVCDGPRGNCKGGRYGALPKLWPYLDDDFVLLLDDVNRRAEMQVLERWTREFPIESKIVIASGDGRAFAIVRRKSVK